MSETKELVERAYAAYARGDAHAMADLFAPDCEIVGPGAPGPIRGRDALVAFLASQMKGFPDGHHTIRRTIEQGEAIAVELEFAGTHTGPLPGPSGDIAPTGRQVTLESCDVITVQAGKLTSWRVYLDSASLMAQLGLMPAAGR
jgi:ketosteroid isomerase-like protein